MTNQFEDESTLKQHIIALGGSVDALYDMANDGTPIFNRPEALDRLRVLKEFQIQRESLLAAKSSAESAKESVDVSKRALTVSWVAIVISVIALIVSVVLFLKDGTQNG